MRVHQAQEPSSAQELDLRNELRSASWQKRRAVIDRFLQLANDPAAEQILRMLRDDHRNLACANAAIQVLAQTASDVVPGLLELLEFEDADLRCYVALTLGERGDPRAIPALIERLADVNNNVRTHAIEALGKLRAAAAVDSLVAFVEELNFELAFPAIDALKAIGDRRIAHRLLPLLNHSLYKLAAVEALGELGDEEVIRSLLNGFQDPDIPTTDVGIALAKIHERHEELYGNCQIIPQLVRDMAGPAVVQAMLSTVANHVTDAGRLATVLSWLQKEEIDWTLASLLERFPFDAKVLQAVTIRGSAIVPLLASRLTGASVDVRQAIIEVLLRVSDRKSAPALLQIVDSDDDELAVARALEALTRMSEPRVYRGAMNHFGHSSARIRQAAVAAFGCVSRESAVSDLQTLWQSSSPLVRDSVLRAAGYLGEPECQMIVVAGCGDPDMQVRRTAIEQLATIDDDRARLLLKAAIQSEISVIRAAAFTAVPKIDVGQDSETLTTSALTDSDVWVRYFAIRALIALGTATEHLAELSSLATGDVAMQVRIVAIEALGNCGQSGFPVLVDLAASQVADIREAAIFALPRTGHPEAYTVLITWLTSSPESNRRKAIQALAIFQTPEAVDILYRIAIGTDERLAREAVAALGQFQLPAASTALVESLNWPRRRSVATAALVGAPLFATSALKVGLSNTSVDVRRAAVAVLSRIRSEAAIEVLETALRDAAPSVRHAALTALAHLAPKTAAKGSELVRGRRS